MNHLAEITRRYAPRIGTANERASFMHSAEAAAAAREMAEVATSEYIGKTEYNFVWRIGQVLGDARYFSAVSHEVGDVYQFVPSRLTS